jgi:tetratricopeptide (TPR) repeat protein/predicted Ser/Thr protein kinase
LTCPSETRLQAFVEGELEADAIDELSVHLDTCVECRTIVGAVQPVPLDDETMVERVGRYVLRRVLGRGGMGVVYEAADPELHREVALKVLRPDLGRDQERLLGEAQAMAKLSHPNVVTIYDVGREAERVFIVMALVRGITLRQWLAQEQRSLAAILAAFEQAARGLGAAHDAGLVHRDFKPENVFVDRDERVLVGDFGLAISGVLDGGAAAEGSLAYMAPEQRAGETVDARSDQFSFCLALDEAIEGSLEGRAGAPGWLRKAISRGQNVSPADRFPSMAALEEAIAGGRRRAHTRRRTLGTAALVGAVVGAFALVAHLRARVLPTYALCNQVEPVASIWNEDVTSRTRRAFEATSTALWRDAWRQTETTVSSYAESWSGARKRTCEAAAARRDAVDPSFDRKLACLSDRLEILRAVTVNLESADAAMLEQVPSMLALLPRVNACEDAEQLAQLPPLPPPEKIASVEAAKKQIAQASATIAAGRYREGLALAEDAWRSANGTSFLPAMAEARLWVGTAHGRLGNARESERALAHAASSASAGHSPLLAIRAWIQLLHFVGFEEKRYEDGSQYAEYARVALEPMPQAFELEAERLSWSRAMLLDQKRFSEALAMSHRELALVELHFGGGHRLTAAALDGLAGGLVGSCKAREALAPQEKSCAILEKELGALHPQLALCLGNLAALHANLGEHEIAIGLKRRALGMFEQVPGHPNHVAMAHRNSVRSLVELGRFDEAAAELEVAAGLSKRETEQVSILLLRGDLLRRQDKAADALKENIAAVAKTEKAEPARRIDPLLALVDANLALERFSDALTNAEQASTIARSVYGDGSCRLAEPLRLQAEALVGSGRTVEALPLAEKAVQELATAQIDPLAVARAELTLAAALPESERARAFELATRACDLARQRHDQRLEIRAEHCLSLRR